MTERTIIDTLIAMMYLAILPTWCAMTVVFTQNANLGIIVRRNARKYVPNIGGAIMPEYIDREKLLNRIKDLPTRWTDDEEGE